MGHNRVPLCIYGVTELTQNKGREGIVDALPFIHELMSAKLVPTHCESGALQSARVPIPSKVRNHNAKGELVGNK